MKTTRHLLGASLAGALLALSGGASASIIDLFTFPASGGGAAGQQVTDASNTPPPDPLDGTDDTGTNFSEVGADASIIGGYRDLRVTAYSGAAGGNQTSLRVFQVPDGSNNGILSFSNDAFVQGEGVVQWDGMDNSSDLDRDGLGGEDLTQNAGCGGPCVNFVFNVLSLDQADFQFVLGVSTDDDNYSEFTLQAGGGLGPRAIPIAVFGNDLLCAQANVECGINGAADLTNVGALELVLLPGGASIEIDLSISGIVKQGVPEPGIVGLMGMGLLGAGLVSIRRRRKSLS